MCVCEREIESMHTFVCVCENVSEVKCVYIFQDICIKERLFVSPSGKKFMYVHVCKRETLCKYNKKFMHAYKSGCMCMKKRLYKWEWERECVCERERKK